MSDYSHAIVSKRHHPVGIASIIVWTVGVIGIVVFVATTKGLSWAPILLILTVAAGWPIPDAGTPHQWVLREWHRRAQWRHDEGRIISPPLSDESQGQPCGFERVEGVLARVQLPGKPDGFVPLFTDETRTHVTIALRLSGASPQWLGSDADGKSSWNLAFFEGIAQALGVTNEPDLEVFFVHAHRPADVESMLRLARARYDEEVRNAAISDPESVKGRLGLNLADRIDMNYSSGGNPLEYVFVRMPWPRGWRGKIGVNDAEAFRRTHIFKTIKEVQGVYESLGITASLLSPLDAQYLWDELYNVTDLSAYRRYRQLDQLQQRRARTAAGAETNSTEKVDAEANQFELQMTQSLRGEKPSNPGRLCYGRTYHIAGYCKGVKKDLVAPAFILGFHMPDDVYWTTTVHVKAVLRDSEALKTREIERGMNITQGLNLLNKGVTDPKGTQDWSEVVRKRWRLRNAGNRIARVNVIFGVAANPAEKAEEDWETLLTRLATTYKIERLEHRDDIENAELAAFGMKLKPI